MTFKYLFDSYAIFEIIEGNTNYLKYEDEDFIINNFIFAELCYNFYKDKVPQATEKLREYSKHIYSVKSEWIEEAMHFRLKWKDRKVSMTDCIGYIMAKRLGLKFLTGDKEFRDMENVEFVK